MAQLVASQELRETLMELGAVLKDSIGGYKSAIGSNLAALRFMSIKAKSIRMDKTSLSDLIQEEAEEEEEKKKRRQTGGGGQGGKGSKRKAGKGSAKAGSGHKRAKE